MRIHDIRIDEHVKFIWEPIIHDIKIKMENQIIRQVYYQVNSQIKSKIVDQVWNICFQKIYNQFGS
jgi:hypothetical protein